MRLNIMVHAMSGFGRTSQELVKMFTNQHPDTSEYDLNFIAATDESHQPPEGRVFHSQTPRQGLQLYYYFDEVKEEEEENEKHLLEKFAKTFEQFLVDQNMLAGLGTISASDVFSNAIDETILPGLRTTLNDIGDSITEGLKSFFSKNSDTPYRPKLFFSNTKEEYQTKASCYFIGSGAAAVLALGLAFVHPAGLISLAVVAFTLLCIAAYNQVRASQFDTPREPLLEI